MKDFTEELHKTFFAPMTSDFTGWVIFILIWLLLIFLVGIIIYGILCAINSWFMPTLIGEGEVTGMFFEEAHYSTYYLYNAATKTQMPVTTWHPNAWKLIIGIDGAEDYFYLPAEQYTKQKIGGKINVRYTKGRLWKSIKIQSILT